VLFKDVIAIVDVEPVGMMIYALTEVSTSRGARRFVFANWNEDGQARLEIEARAVTFESRFACGLA